MILRFVLVFPLILLTVWWVVGGIMNVMEEIKKTRRIR